MKIERMTMTMERKFIPPGGDRFQPHQVSVTLEAIAEPGETRDMIGLALRQITKEELVKAMKEEML